MENILVVDDEESVRDSLQRYLSRRNYCVELAENGKEALEKCKKKNYDIILSDHRMPEMSGPQLFEQVKEFSPLPKLIMMSALLPENFPIKFEYYHIIPKPVDFKNICNILQIPNADQLVK